MPTTALARLSILCILIALTACESGEYVGTPKPRTYPRIDFPERAYRSFDEAYCDFTFEYPTYARVEQDKDFFGEAPSHPCWFDIYYPQFDARIHATYESIDGYDAFEELRNDAHDLAGKHNIRADYIDEFPVQREDGTAGFVFDIEGAAASPFQFYLTDTTSNFLRGAVYFNTSARPDSLAPVAAFLKEDVLQLVNTLEWGD